MKSPVQVLNSSEAAKRLGVSTKALRLYEQRGLITPHRTDSGWRAYGPAELDCAGEIVALRGLGLSLSQIASVLGGDSDCLEQALTEHQAALEKQMWDTAKAVEKVRALRADIASGGKPDIEQLSES